MGSIKVDSPLLLMALIAWEFMLYGAYVVLFGVCTHVLLKRKKASYKYYQLAHTLIFLLVLANLALDTTGTAFLLLKVKMYEV
ncbi:hypothetical protein VNI00_007295 [Paramarasmius palmivorus]|uniref:NADH dehydrogenase subunit 4 n=1 Tax=Paramarasmius palmivorus TaxID=297713 RepID=A0AAW0D0F4_9AGAR